MREVSGEKELSLFLDEHVRVTPVDWNPMPWKVSN